MKLKKIKNISGYKSFSNYNIDELPDSIVRDFSLQKFSFIFAENGCGKSSFCDIVKNMCGQKDFEDYFPSSASLEFTNETVDFDGSTWSSHAVNKGDILFFDTDFINHNVHRGKTRLAVSGEQEQNSGQLLIDFDEQAIYKKIAYEKQRVFYTNLNTKKTNNENAYLHELTVVFPNIKNNIFNYYKGFSQSQLDLIKDDRNNYRKLVSEKITDYEKNIDNTNVINEIADLHTISNSDIFIPVKKTSIESIFSFEIPENTINFEDENKAELVEKIKIHKDFFDKGKDIISGGNENQCPYCDTIHEDDTIKNIIDILSEVVGGVRKKSEEKLNSLIDECIQSLSLVSSYKNLLDKKIEECISKFDELKNNFDIANINKFNSTELYKTTGSFSETSISELTQHLEGLRDYKKHSFDENLFINFINELKKLYSVNIILNREIKEKNKLIKDFRDKYGNKDNIEKDKKELENILNKIDIELEYLDYDNIQKEKKRIKLELFLASLRRILEKQKSYRDTLKQDYVDYISSEIFEKTIESMNGYIEKFNLDLSIIPQTSRRNTSEHPFSYILIDSHEHIRTINDGLSEGERQILSLSFFFAWIDNHSNIDNKILIFDDPITSMDSGNLNRLAKLILEKGINFEQVIILTHHPLFFKYLSKNSAFTGGCSKYLILKNKIELGGSFITSQKYFNNIEELRRITTNEHEFISPSTDYENNIIRYGQLLRYEVERLIKDKILQWYSENNFENITKKISGIINSVDSGNLDLKKVSDIYSYCNWSNTNHVGVDGFTNWSELKENIIDFLEIIDSFEAGN